MQLFWTTSKVGNIKIHNPFFEDTSGKTTVMPNCRLIGDLHEVRGRRYNQLVLKDKKGDEIPSITSGNVVRFFMMGTAMWVMISADNNKPVAEISKYCQPDWETYFEMKCGLFLSAQKSVKLQNVMELLRKSNDPNDWADIERAIVKYLRQANRLDEFLSELKKLYGIKQLALKGYGGERDAATNAYKIKVTRIYDTINNI